jgi:hypothetical protein
VYSEEYAQFYGAMNTMNGRMVTMRKDGLPYEDMGYVPPPNRWALPSLSCFPVFLFSWGFTYFGEGGGALDTPMSFKVENIKKWTGT